MASQEILLFLGSLKPFPLLLGTNYQWWKGRASNLYSLWTILYFSLIGVYLMGYKFTHTYSLWLVTHSFSRQSLVNTGPPSWPRDLGLWGSVCVGHAEDLPSFLRESVGQSVGLRDEATVGMSAHVCCRILRIWANYHCGYWS